MKIYRIDYIRTDKRNEELPISVYYSHSEDPQEVADYFVKDCFYECNNYVHDDDCLVQGEISNNEIIFYRESDNKFVYKISNIKIYTMKEKWILCENWHIS